MSHLNSNLQIKIRTDLHERALVSHRYIQPSPRLRRTYLRDVALLVGILFALMSLSESLQAQTWLSVTASSTTTGAATVTWNTAVPSDSQVEYGPTAAYGNISALAPARITSHSVALSGLTAGTTYHFRVRSSDGSGVLVTGGDNTLATTSAVKISLSPLTASLAASGTQQFTATVSNDPNTTVLWKTTAGTVTASGGFTAPASSAATVITITATSQADPTKSATATIQIAASQGSNTMMFGDPATESLVNILPAGTAEGYRSPLRVPEL
jgi:Purple acid Phosphatase, N-terminal domain